jgi:hypothetical protein
MQTIPFLPNHQKFDREVVRSMSVAYASVCRALGLTTKPDPATEVVALKIMEIAERGARTPLRDSSQSPSVAVSPGTMVPH